MENSGKTVLVTGGGAGLGRAICLALVKRGVLVGVCDIDSVGAKKTVNECDSILKGSAKSLVNDLSSATGASEVVSQMVSHFGCLSGVVNNAGYATVEPFLNMTAKAWNKTLGINVIAMALLCAEAGRVMIERNIKGRIVNITSPAARMALPNYAHYAASKAAVDSITRTAAIALAPSGINVNSLAPGMMDTHMQIKTETMMAEIEGRDDLDAYLQERTARIPVGKRTEVDEMAGLVVWLLFDAPNYVTAERLNGSGGLDRD
ncbi:MAG: short-chain dehydrogenase [Rhodospirillaceae bacterium]|nr:short-chain dehydrogenase [Rhodospirillaceae bacterium]